MVNENADEFWKRVKALIKEKKTTQEYVAGKCGVTLGVFKAWIFNNRLPDAAQCVHMAGALGTTAEFLVTGEQKKQDNSEAIALILSAVDLLR